MFWRGQRDIKPVCGPYSITNQKINPVVSFSGTCANGCYDDTRLGALAEVYPVERILGVQIAEFLGLVLSDGALALLERVEEREEGCLPSSSGCTAEVKRANQEMERQLLQSLNSM